MMPPDEPMGVAEVLAAAKRLEDFIPSLQDDIAYLKKHGEGSRRWIKWITAAGAVITLVLIAVVITYARADGAYNKAVTVQEYQKETCVVGNETRAAQRELWAYVVDLSSDLSFRPDKGKGPMTTDERRQLAEFRTFVNTRFAERDCAKVDSPGKDLSPSG